MRLLPWVFIGRGWTCLIQFSGGNQQGCHDKDVKNNGGLGIESSTSNVMVS